MPGVHGARREMPCDGRFHSCCHFAATGPGVNGGVEALEDRARVTAPAAFRLSSGGSVRLQRRAHAGASRRAVRIGQRCQGRHRINCAVRFTGMQCR